MMNISLAGRETLPDTLLEQCVLAAEDAYVDLGEELGIGDDEIADLHLLPFCRSWSLYASKRVRDRVDNFDRSATVKIVRSSKAGRAAHDFVVVEPSDEQPFGIDGTWGQFFWSGWSNNEFPRVLAGTFNEMHRVAVQVGLPDRHLEIWDTANLGTVSTQPKS